MKCSVCKGTGVHYPPHVPSDSGGWLDEKYIFAAECGACGGSGFVDEAEGDQEYHEGTADPEEVEPAVDLAQLVELRDELLSRVEESELPSGVRERWTAAIRSISFALGGILTRSALDALYEEIHSASEQPSRFVSHTEPGKLALVEMDLSLIAGALGRLRHYYALYRARQQ